MAAIERGEQAEISRLAGTTWPVRRMISRLPFLVGVPWFDSGVACWQTCCHVDDQRPCRQLDQWCAALGARPWAPGLKD
jgi:hypothetical protein